MFAVAVLVSGGVSHVIQAVDSDFGVANLRIVDFPLFRDNRGGVRTSGADRRGRVVE